VKFFEKSLRFEQIKKMILVYFYKSDICKLFTFNLDFPSLRFPLATSLGCHFPIFHTFLLIVFPALFFVVKKKFSHKELRKMLNIGLVMYDVIIVGVTREIVQPAKASNFSENRLLKRASPYDTETIYQLLFISSMFHYSFLFKNVSLS
jgi:hypothetical protein